MKDSQNKTDRSGSEGQNETFVRRKFDLPDWVTGNMIANFLEMWDVFGRDELDYFVARNEYRGRHKTDKNGRMVTMKKLIGDEIITGEFCYKWNNIGWIFDGTEVHHVCF